MKCFDCRTTLKDQHPNRKRCESCAVAVKNKPKHKLTELEISKVKKLIGKMPRKDIGKKLSLSDSSLQRWARDEGVSFAFHTHLACNQKLVKEICEYYSAHGMIKTRKKYPKVKLRSVIERYYERCGLPPRTIRWTDQQLVQLARFGGIASFTEIAKYFGRPNAFNGSIKSAWVKKFGHGCLYLNGAPSGWGKNFVTRDCPQYMTNFSQHKKASVRIHLWVDMEKYLKPEIPKHIVDAIVALAKFQKWLHGKNYRANIMRIFRGEL